MSDGRVSRFALQTIARLVPASERADWLKEWEAEMAFESKRSAQRNTTRRLLAALQHAAFLRFRPQSTDVSRVWFGLADDLKYAVRGIRQAPLFSTTVVVTLALGVGLVSGILAFADGYLFKPLPFPAADRAYYVRDPNAQIGSMVSATDARILRESSIGDYGFVEWSLSNTLQELTIDDVRVPAFAYQISRGFRRTLELPLTTGRDFTAEDHQDGAPLVGWLSHRFWQQAFGGSTAVLDRVLAGTGPRGPVNIRIVGILGAEVTTLDATNEPPDLVVPAQGIPREGPNRLAFPIVLLPPDVSAVQASAQMASILQAGAPAADGRPRVVRLGSFDRTQRGGGAPTARILFTGALLVMVLAAMNLIHLLLGRGQSRLGDVATRVALGASRWRVTRALLVESLVFAALGIGLGLLAGKGMAVVIAATIPELPTAGRNLSMMPVMFDGRVMLIGAAFGLLAAVAGGLWPARRAWRASLTGSVRNPTRPTARLARVILASELTVVTIVAAGAVYAGTGIYRYLNKPLGFDIADRVEINLQRPAARVSPPEIALALEAVRATAGIRVAAGQTVAVPGEESVEVPGIALDTKRLGPQGVPPGLFEAWGWKLVQGRWFTNDEFERSDAIVINQSFAKFAWPNGGAIGATIRTGPNVRTVVGVIASHQWRLDMPLRNELFVPVPKTAGSTPIVAWAPGVSAEDIQSRLVSAVESAAPGVKARARMLTFDSYFARGLGEARFQAPIVLSFGVLASILAVIGVFGIVSFLVSQRTREFGIRLALGATRADVRRSVITESLLPAIIGVTIGSVGAWLLGRAVRSAVFEWDTSGPIAIAIVITGLLGVAALAAFVPAIRASSIDPATSLRE